MNGKIEDKTPTHQTKQREPLKFEVLNSWNTSTYLRRFKLKLTTVRSTTYLRVLKISRVYSWNDKKRKINISLRFNEWIVQNLNTKHLDEG